jgi:hypothetical protein
MRLSGVGGGRGRLFPSDAHIMGHGMGQWKGSDATCRTDPQTVLWVLGGLILWGQSNEGWGKPADEMVVTEPANFF